jgi:hypothetical protein
MQGNLEDLHRRVIAMETTEKIQKVLSDRSIGVDVTQQRIDRLLREEGAAGARLAVATVIEAKSEVMASFPANFLAGLPGHREEKNAALRGLMTRQPDWSAAVANLVEFADDENVERLIHFAVRSPDGPGVSSIVYELAQHFPDRMRAHRSQIEPHDVYELLLPGAPEDWVAEIVTNGQRTGDGKFATQLSYVRTNPARNALITLMNRAPSSSRQFFAALVESSGVFADTRGPSTYEESFRGFLTDGSQSPHKMGGVPPGPVPVSIVEQKPAERILELKRDALPMRVGGTFDPIFFWYEGRLPPGHIYVKLTKEGREGLMTPMGTGGHDSFEFVTARGSLALEKERHAYGLGSEAVAGSARVQVGGYPHWRTPETFPRCPGCGKGMKFVASVDSGLTPFGGLAFDGTLYGFWCEACDVACTRRQR